MKKRILSAVLTLILCITMLPSAAVFAAEPQAQTELESYAAQAYSDWAAADLETGNSYGIIPSSWFQKDMTAPITKAQLRVLLAGLRNKLLNTECVDTANETPVSLGQSFTVGDVLETLYNQATDYQFTPVLTMKDTNYLNFMKNNGIYTGKNGEQTLKDSCSLEQACVIATRLVTVIYDQLDAESKGFFYVTKANGNTVYMLGSIHFGSNDIYPLNDKIIKAYQESDALAVELNLYNQSGAMELLQLAQYTDGTTLKDHISADTYQKVITFAKTLGYDEKTIAMFKPWYLYISFTSLSATNSGTTAEAAQSAGLGIDMSFINNALVNNKPVLEVEGYGSQARMLDSFSDELEEYLLNETITAVNEVVAGKSDSGSDSLEEMLALWRKGEEKDFEKYSSFEYEYQDTLEDASSAKEKEFLAEMKEKMFTIRDAGMADYIDGLLKGKDSKTYFVVVGSAHYVSNYDVIDILTKKGYEITQIK